MNEEQKQAVAVTPQQDFRRALSQMESQFKMVLPPRVTPERFIRIVMTAVQTTPSLLTADRQSLLSACMKAAQAGLLPDGRESALAPFNRTVTFMPMVAGILKLMRNSGELLSLSVQVVYENDVFEYWVDETGEHLRHEPALTGSRGEKRLVYAIGRTKDGGIYIEVLTNEQVLAIRSVSRSGASGPWNGPFEDEMWKKSAIRRLSKRMPMSTDFDGIEDDDLRDVNQRPTDAPAVPATATTKRKSRLSTIVQGTMGDVMAVETPTGDDGSEGPQDLGGTT